MNETIFYYCLGPMSWGRGSTPQAALREARRYSLPGDLHGCAAQLTWRIWQTDARVRVRPNMSGLHFGWDDDEAAPYLVEVLDGRGRRLPLPDCRTMQADD
ncbi:hypothetical protein [Rhodovastum atsumiense]|uniref:Uncharacterized protein n=1 Tax=Rhodovastum atsumiense TaxID=504468 RepID=A0A5M6IJE1_9PROT|nr:hypothetical protein [Rhodovastum atsumiense]KAA5607987.1 hypothetical protein F1189_31230 [Rhodovastum atsumiense]